MKPLARRRGKASNASAIFCLLQTYFVHTSGFATISGSRLHTTIGTPCRQTSPRYGCCGSVRRRRSAVSMSWTRGQLPAAVRLTGSFLQPGSRCPDRTNARRSSTTTTTTISTTSRKKRGSAVRAESAADDVGGESPGVSSAPGAAPAAGSATGSRGSGDAAQPRPERPADSDAGNPSSAKGWGLERLQRKAFELPEDTAEEGRFLMMAALVGVITGTAVTVFKTLIGTVKEFSYSGDLLGRFPPGGAASTYVGAFIPVLGALGVVSMMWLLQLKSYGPGLGGLTEEVDRQVPWSPRRTLGKTLAAVATLGTGNSLGPEGPAVELGVASSRYVSAMSNLSVQRQRMLLGAGAAAGVAAGFNAPIAGIFFALEIVKDTFNTNYNSKSFIAATLLCAVVSALMAKIGLHDELSLRPAAYNLESPLIELPLYLGLGVVAGLVAVMFKYFSRKKRTMMSSDVFKGNFPGFGWMKGVPQWSKPIMMAAVTGAVGVFFPQVLFFGYDTLDKLLANTGSYSLPLLCFLCVAKAMLTAGALGSGLVGGTFAPSLFLGATAGAAYQRILQGLLTAFRTTAGPSLATLSTFLLPLSSRLGIGGPAGDLSSLLTIAGSPAYAMVGAAAVLSALYRAPLTGSLLLFELTKDYDIVLPLMAAAGVSSLVVELFSRADAPVVQARLEAAAGMPRDMSLEIGLKISGKVDKLMGKIQVTDALVPRILTLTADTSLSEAMRAFRLTRNEFAVVVARSGYESFEVSTSSSSTLEGAGGQAGTNGDATGWHAQTVLAEDMWERRDMKLVGVLALREINLALDRERANFYGDDDGRPELTAGSVCRQNCFTVKTSTDIASAKRLMNLKAVRYLPVVVDLPPSPSPDTSAAAPATAAAAAAAAAPRPPSRPPGTAAASAIAAPFARKRSSNTNNKDGEDSSTRNSNQRGGDSSVELPPPPLPPPPPPPQAVVGVLSRESLRIAGRLTETERAIRDRPRASPPPTTPLPLSPLSSPPSPDAEGER